MRTFEPRLLLDALWVSLKRLTPMAQWRNPVMFVTWIGALLTTVVAINDRDAFTAAIAAWLWLTVLFANFAEALAEGRGKAQAAQLARREERHAGDQVEWHQARFTGHHGADRANCARATSYWWKRANRFPAMVT